MTTIIQTNDEGEDVEVEVFTQAEIDAKLGEKDKEWESKMAEKDTSIQTIAKEKADLEAKLGGTKEDHPNFKALKEALKEKDTQMKALQDEVSNDKKMRLEEAMNTKIKNFSKGDDEVEKKIKLHLSSTLKGMPESTEDERMAKLTAAVKLSSDSEPNILDGVMYNGMGGGGEYKSSGEGSVEFTSREKALGAKFGLTEEDYKKYGPRITKRK